MLLVSPSTYVASVSFLAIMGLVFTSVLEKYSQQAQEVSPAMEFFALFWIPVVITVPFLTMKSISEERRLGTLETLLTTSVTTTEVVVGKFAAAYLLYLAIWSTTGSFFWILRKFAQDPRFFDPGPLFGGYLFITISGAFFIAIGIFTSSLSRNQAVAAILSGGGLLALLFGPLFLGPMEFLNNQALRPLKIAISYIDIFRHLGDFSQGIVDTRQVLFYLSGCVLALMFSILCVEAKLLHS